MSELNNIKFKPASLYYFTALAIFVWTIFIGGSFAGNIIDTFKHTEELALNSARVHLNKDLAVRFWVTKHGGVYVPAQETKPNPYLKNVPERDIKTPSGKLLTLINPAYMMRLIMDEYDNLYGIKTHITSLNLMNPMNKPDEWERYSLLSFNKMKTNNAKLAEIYKISRDKQGKSELRLIKPLITQKSCLKCHGYMGYKEGDIRGGISVSIPMKMFSSVEKRSVNIHLLTHALFWIFGLSTIFFVLYKAKHRLFQYQQAMDALQSSERNHKMLLENLTQKIFYKDRTSTYLLCNESYANDFHIKPHEIVGKTDYDLFSKEIADKYRESDKRIIETGESKDIEEEYIHNNNKLIVHTVKTPIKDHSGNVIGILGIFWDISDRKRNDEKIQLASTVFESITEGIIITNTDGIIESVNPAFTELTGYTIQEAIGKNPQFLKSKRHDEKFYQDIFKSLAINGYWKGEIWNRRKNGHIYPAWFSIAAIKDSSGNITKYAGFFSDITGKKEYEELIEHRAYHDPLTDLPNRLLFSDRLDHALVHAQRYSKNLAVIFLDLDNFKQINDHRGHDFGDRVLIKVANLLKGCIRKEDTISRMGGDEFTLFLPDINQLKYVLKIAQKILTSFASPIKIDNDEISITSSIGISIFPQDGNDSEELIKKADRAMYRAKQMGKNNYQLYSELQ
ncbi:MAG: diguanylate cyclase [Spirochaetota bacterium]|nr:diguanylate cyclase [Spirochaetota bacterium]